MTAVLHLAAKVVLSGILGLVAGVCIYEIYRLWLDRTLVLARFDYVREGQAANDAGQHFARLISVDMMRIAGLYGLGRRRDSFSLPSTDQIGRAESLDLPELRESMLESVELKAYGMEVGSLLKTLQRWIERPREIQGSVTERNKLISVYAELKGGRDGGVYWQVSDAASVTDATWGIACRVFRMLARDPERGSADARIFSEVSDEDFCLFNEALEKYQRYRTRVAEARAAEAKTALDDAHRLTTALTDRNTKFPWAHKLSGFVLLELNRFDDAERAIRRYLDWATENKRPDKAATDLLEAIRAKRQPAAAPLGVSSRGRVRPVQPGSGVSLADGSRNVGTICCVVRDAAGAMYLLSADQVFTGVYGASVIQPAVADGGKETDAVATYARTGDTAALARLLDHVQAKNDVLDLGVFTAVGGDVKAGDLVRAVGRSAGKVEGTVDRANASLSVEVGEGSATRKRLDNIILTSSISNPGDSGAPVLTEDGRLIGMVYAASQSSTVVVPIERILKELEVEVVR